MSVFKRNKCDICLGFTPPLFICHWSKCIIILFILRINTIFVSQLNMDKHDKCHIWIIFTQHSSRIKSNFSPSVCLAHFSSLPEGPYLVRVAHFYMAFTSAYCVSVWRLVEEVEDLCPPCPAENLASSAYWSSPGLGFVEINI